MSKAVLRVVVATVLTLMAAGCSGSHSPRAAELTKLQKSPTPPATKDEIALFNDGSTAVSVLGCAGCGRSGRMLHAATWLTLNLPANGKQVLQLKRGDTTTCFVIVGFEQRLPLVLRVSQSAASAC
jgi:hypothetical protein